MNNNTTIINKAVQTPSLLERVGVRLLITPPSEGQGGGFYVL